MAKIDALKNFPEMLVKNEQMWKVWYELEAPESKPFPDSFDQRLSRFQRLLVVCFLFIKYIFLLFFII